MAYVSQPNISYKHGRQIRRAPRSFRVDHYARRTEKFQPGYGLYDSPSPSNVSAISFEGSGADYGPSGLESPATMLKDPFMMQSNTSGYGSFYTPESSTSNLWSVPRPLTNIKAEPNGLSPPKFPNMNCPFLSPGSWRPNPDLTGHNTPPCPRCARKGPSFVTRYHPCKGFPCSNCKSRTRRAEGTGGLNAYQCATDRGGTPEHQQKEHKPQRRPPVYPMGGIHWAKLKSGEELPAWKVEHPGVAMGYTQEEMDDVCPGCAGWEWCWCETERGEGMNGWALEQKIYRLWGERYQAKRGSSGNSSKHQGSKSSDGASRVSQRCSDHARVTKRESKKTKIKLGTPNEVPTQARQMKESKASHKGKDNGSDVLINLVGDVLKKHYQRKGKQPIRPTSGPDQPQQLASRPKVALEKSKIKLETWNEKAQATRQLNTENISLPVETEKRLDEMVSLGLPLSNLAQAHKWRADVLAKQDAGCSDKAEHLVNVEADHGTDLQKVARHNVDWASAKEFKEHSAEEKMDAERTSRRHMWASGCEDAFQPSYRTESFASAALADLRTPSTRGQPFGRIHQAQCGKSGRS